MSPTTPDLPTADASGRLVAGAPAPRLPDEAPADAADDGLGAIAVAALPNTLLLRRPDADRGAGEQALVAGHERARRDAIDRLANWLPELPTERLALEPGHVAPTATPVDPQLVTDLDVPALADRVLAEHDMSAPKLIVAADGNPEHQLPPDDVVAPPVGRYDHPHALAGPLARLLVEGTTVVVHAVHTHHAPLADVTESLAVALGTQVGANLYLSRADAPGFGPHWDDHDVLVVQGIGTRHWKVFEPIEEAPIATVSSPAVGTEVAWEGDLAVGQALYVPRGWGHQASGGEDLSAHLTLTLQRLRYDQVAGFTAGLGGFWPLFRADVPFDAHERVTSYAGSLYDEPGRFGQTVVELAASDALEHGTAQWLAKLPARRAGRLSTTLAALHREDWSDVVVRGSFPGGVAVMDEKADPRLVTRDGGEPALAPAAERDRRPVLAAGGRLIELDAWAVPALGTLLDGRPARVGDLPLGPIDGATPELATALRTRLASGLVGLGLVDVVEVLDVS